MISNYSYSPLGFLFIIVVAISFSPVKAQQPVLVQNQDTVYFDKNPMLDEVLVTAKRYSEPESLDNLISNSELNTSVSGLTKNLQRDLPSMIRLYTPQGIPMLTKYTSNSSLTSTIPDSAIGLKLSEPSAKFPNPDAPVIMRPNYRQRASASMSPLKQSAVIGSDTTHQKFGGNLALSRSGSTQMFEMLVPELQAYNSSYAGYGAGQVDLGKSRAEVIIHLSRSENEYGELLGIEKLEEIDRSASVFFNTQHQLGNKILDAGFAHQSGYERRQVQEISNEYEEINEIDAFSFTAGISNNTTELRANFHDLQRVYPYGPEGTVHLQRLETVFKHTQHIFSFANLTAEGRYDFNDREPSISGNMQVSIHPRVNLNLNAGRLYDAIGSEGLNNLMRSVQIGPHPWEVTHVRFGTEYFHKQIQLQASVSHKKLLRGWYGSTAENSGWIARLGADGLMYGNSINDFYLKWNMEGVVRDLVLDVNGQPSRAMPGPARLEGHFSLVSGIGKMEYSVLTDVFVDRKMRVNQNLYGGLGSQYFLSIGVSRKMGIVELGAKLDNGLALLGKKNKIIAHYSERKRMTYVTAPPVINLNLGINFY